MNVEQRLIEAFQTSAQVEPTPDLFSRVLHSIDEDRQHRRRVVRTVAVLLSAVAAFVFAVVLSVEDGRRGHVVHRPTLEILEVVALATILLTLGPAIRRFGRGYAADLWPRGSTTPGAILRLLDLAYYLVGTGYILLSTEFHFADGLFAAGLGDQLSDASIRIGGLVMTLGILHATTFFTLPLVALIDNSTRVGKTLPRWIVLLLLMIGLNILPIIPVAVGVAIES